MFSDFSVVDLCCRRVAVILPQPIGLLYGSIRSTGYHWKKGTHTHTNEHKNVQLMYEMACYRIVFVARSLNFECVFRFMLTTKQLLWLTPAFAADLVFEFTS